MGHSVEELSLAPVRGMHNTLELSEILVLADPNPAGMNSFPRDRECFHSRGNVFLGIYIFPNQTCQKSFPHSSTIKYA
jgi:hypothetical protein